MNGHIKYMHINKGVRQYQCNSCQKACTKLSSLKDHFAIIHDGIRHRFQFCSKVATTKGEINSILEKIMHLKLSITSR